MFSPTVELKAVVDGNLITILTKEIALPPSGFPECIIYRDEPYMLVDWVENQHGVYEKTTFHILRHEPVTPA